MTDAPQMMYVGQAGGAKPMDPANDGW